MAGRTTVGLLAGIASGLCALPALAQQASTPDSAKALTLELNGMQPSDKGCRLTFVVTNELGADLTRAAFEIALFDEAGVVNRLTVLEFKDLTAGKTKVSRFDLAGTDCARVSRVLVNGVVECGGQGIEPATCLRGLKTSSRAGIPFGL
jgi:hypothetical protein